MMLMLMGLAFIIGAVEGEGRVGGFEVIPLSELKNYPEIEKGLEKGIDEYNANLRKEVQQATKRLIINQIVSVKKQTVQGSRFVVEVGIVPSMCENTEEAIPKSRQCPALQNAASHYCIFSIWSRTFVNPPNNLIVKIINCSQD